METTFASISDIERKVKSIIAWKLGVSEKEITPDSNFSDNLYADEFDIVDLVMEFEKEFHISIPDKQIEKIRTVSEAVASIRKNSRPIIDYNPAYSLLVGPPLYHGYQEGESKKQDLRYKILKNKYYEKEHRNF